MALGRWVPSLIPKVPPRCHGGQKWSIYPGWMGLGHLSGGGGVGGGGKGGIGGVRVGQGGGLGECGQGRVVLDSLGRVMDDTPVLIYGG